MTSEARKRLFTDPESYPGQRRPDARPALSRDEWIAVYQRHPIPGQLPLPLAAAATATDAATRASVRST